MDHIFADVRADSKGRVADVALIRTNSKGIVNIAYQTPVDDFITFKRVHENICTTVAAPHLESKVIVIVGNYEMRQFLRAECKELGVDELFKGRAWIDISQLAFPLVHSKLVSDRKLETIAKYYGIVFEPGGDAPSNAMTVMRVYWEMMRRYRLALAAEDTLNEVGGSAFKGISEILGF